jgi:hypothetical protein
MKERSKLVKSKKNKTKYELGQRLSKPLDKDEEMKIDSVNVNQRRKEDGKVKFLTIIIGKHPAKPLQ